MKKETQSLSSATSSLAEPYETPANAANRAIFTAEEFPFDAIVKPLTDWFNANKRDLPWRHDPTPYRVWVSEIMLQQTRVEAARDYYLRFLSALPAVEDLAYSLSSINPLFRMISSILKAITVLNTSVFNCEESNSASVSGNFCCLPFSSLSNCFNFCSFKSP